MRPDIPATGLGTIVSMPVKAVPGPALIAGLVPKVRDRAEVQVVLYANGYRAVYWQGEAGWLACTTLRIYVPDGAFATVEGPEGVRDIVGVSELTGRLGPDGAEVAPRVPAAGHQIVSIQA